jgi:hypothetical protein
MQSFVSRPRLAAERPTIEQKVRYVPYCPTTGDAPGRPPDGLR